MSSDDATFDQGDSGANITELADAGRMKPGSLIMMKETFPCKVTSFSTAKPGKHGSAKAMITAKDIFTDKQYEETFGTGDMIPRPLVIKTEVTCIDCNYDDDNKLTLMMPDGELLEHLNLPDAAHLDDVKPRMKAILEAGTKECLLMIQRWGTREQIVACREGQD